MWMWNLCVNWRMTMVSSFTFETRWLGRLRSNRFFDWDSSETKLNENATYTIVRCRWGDSGGWKSGWCDSWIKFHENSRWSRNERISVWQMNTAHDSRPTRHIHKYTKVHSHDRSHECVLGKFFSFQRINLFVDWMLRSEYGGWRS